MPQKADLYTLDGSKLPQTWVLYLPKGAVIGFSKKECLAQVRSGLHRLLRWPEAS